MMCVATDFGLDELHVSDAWPSATPTEVVVTSEVPECADPLPALVDALFQLSAEAERLSILIATGGNPHRGSLATFTEAVSVAWRRVREQRQASWRRWRRPVELTRCYTVAPRNPQLL